MIRWSLRVGEEEDYFEESTPWMMRESTEDFRAMIFSRRLSSSKESSVKMVWKILL